MRFILFPALVALAISCQDPEYVDPSPELPKNVEDMESLLGSISDIKQVKELHWRLYKEYREEAYEEALDHLNDLEALARKSDDNLFLGKALFGQGYIHKVQQNYIQAVDRYLLSIDALEKTDQFGMVGSCLNNLGGIFAETGNHEYAERFYSKAKEIHVQTRDTNRQVLANLNLAICSYSKTLPDYVRAEQLFNEAVNLANLLQESRNKYLNWIYNSAGAMHYKMGNYEEAKSNYLKSIEYVPDGEDMAQLKFAAYCNIGEAAMGASDFVTAKSWIENAVHLLSQGEISKNYIIEARIIEGELNQKMGDHGKAVEVLEAVIADSDSRIINPSLKEALKLLSRSYKYLNDRGKPVSAKSYDNVLALMEMQEALNVELVEKTNFKALQAALGLKIELESEKKEKKAAIASKAVYFNSVIIVICLAFVAAAVLGYRIKKVRDANIIKSKELEAQKRELDEKTAMLNYIEPIALDAVEYVKSTEQLYRKYKLQ